MNPDGTLDTPTDAGRGAPAPARQRAVPVHQRLRPDHARRRRCRRAARQPQPDVRRGGGPAPGHPPRRRQHLQPRLRRCPRPRQAVRTRPQPDVARPGRARRVDALRVGAPGLRAAHRRDGELARKADFTAALPHLGTKLVAYHANENFVCREYGFLGAVQDYPQGSDYSFDGASCADLRIRKPGCDRCRADALPDDFVDNSPMHRHRRPAVHNETGEGLR